MISTTATCPDTVHFYLCRHGQSEFNAKGLLQGHLESPLTERGIAQAQALALKAKHWEINHIVSSHLGRAQQTAQICVEFLTKEVHHRQLTKPQCTADLAERHLGAWQGKAVALLAEFHQFNTLCYQQTHITPPDSHDLNNSLKQSESTDTVRQRMQKALISIAYSKALNSKPSQVQHNVLVISHGDALACLMSMFTQPTPLKNTQGILLSYQDDTLEWGGLLD